MSGRHATHQIPRGSTCGFSRHRKNDEPRTPISSYSASAYAHGFPESPSVGLEIRIEDSRGLRPIDECLTRHRQEQVISISCSGHLSAFHLLFLCRVQCLIRL